MQKNHGASSLRRSRTIPHPIKRLNLTDRDIEALSIVFLQRAVSRRQLQRLNVFTSTPVANARLRMLFDGRYLKREFAVSRLGGTEVLYLLGPAAVEVVAPRLGIDQAEVSRIARAHSPAALTHAQHITDVRISFEGSMPEGVHVEFLAECQVRHEYTVRTEKGTTNHVLKPDGAVLIERGTDRAIAFLEIDLSHVGLLPWKRTCSSYSTYVKLGLHQSAYGVETAEILCITSGGLRRISHLSAIASQMATPMRFAHFSDVLKNGPFGAIWQSFGSPVPTAFFSEVRP